MDQYRKIKKITRGRQAIDGAGVHLVRVFGHADVNDYDPFLLLDAFDASNPKDYIKGFPWHPHRGIETITYLIEGDIEHGDSLGNQGSILSGDCQWMTAGSGIIHQELPKPSKRLLGAQIWLNMPKKDKMASPMYGDILSKDVPIVNEDNAKIKIIAGDYLNHKGAFKGQFVNATYLDVTLKANGSWTYELPHDDTLFIYIVSGQGVFSDQVISEKNAVLFDHGDCFKVETKKVGIRFLLLSATPLKEEIAWGGPIVMNTKEELNLAFKEINEGTFIKR